jgi:hypothetical protein
MKPAAPSLSSRRKLDDLLSPILVKELRQGMRARVFVISFLLIQVFLFILVLGNVVAQEDRNALEVQSHFFWVIVGFALLVMMPLRALVTVSVEVKNRTLETIMLTRLTAWRVVFGKWSALFAQSLLFVSAVLPFVVLRYFVGGDDVVSDVLWMLFMLWLSGILIAVGVAVSGLNSPVIRVIVLVGVIVALSSSIGFTTSLGYGSTSGLEMLGWLLIFGLFIPGLLFELTASGIAPASENHAIARRLVAGFFFVSAWGLFCITKSDLKGALAVPLIVLIGICYFDLAEKPRLLPRMADSMARKGWFGKIAGLFLLPGWPSALLFSLVAIPLAMLAIDSQITPPDLDEGWLLPIFAIFGSILPPIFLCHFFWPKLNQVLLIIFLYNVILMAVASLLEAFAMIAHHSIYLQLGKIFAFMPSLPVLYIAESADAESFKKQALLYIMGNGVVVTAFALLLLLMSRGYFRELIALYRQSDDRKSLPDTPGQAAP